MGDVGVAQQGDDGGGGVRHRDGAGGVHLVARGVGYGVGQEVGTRGVHVHGSRDRHRSGQISVTRVVRGHAGLRPWLAGLACDAGSPEQFQFGIRLVRRDGFETDTEAKEVAAVAGRAAGCRAWRSASAVPVIVPRSHRDGPGPEPDAGPVGVGLGACRDNSAWYQSVDQFPDVAVHVEEAPRVGRVLADVHGLVGVVSAMFVIGIREELMSRHPKNRL